MKIKLLERVLRVAACSALLALGLMLWSFFDVSPLMMVVFMTVGQGLGTLSFVLFVLVVVVDALWGEKEMSEVVSRLRRHT